MPQDYLVYFGTFTDGASKGIYVSKLDYATGEFSAAELAAEVPSPNYLAVSPDGRVLYAATRPNDSDGTVTSYAIQRPSGALVKVDERSAGGRGPCHISVEPGSGTVLVANYTSGSVKSFRSDSEGSLADVSFVQHEGSSLHPTRQTAPHAHCIMPSPGGRFALACDLGTDRVMIYRIDPAGGSLALHKPAFAGVPPGSGPRHLIFSGASKVFVVNELTCTVSSFSWDEGQGSLKLLDTVSLLPDGVELRPEFSAAAIVVSPDDGDFVYATVRGHDSVSILKIGRNGTLSLIGNVPSGGKVPRGLGIDPTGRWLLVGNQRSNTVNVFSVDLLSGGLTPTDQVISVGSPVDVRFVRAELEPVDLTLGNPIRKTGH